MYMFQRFNILRVKNNDERNKDRQEVIFLTKMTKSVDQVLKPATTTTTKTTTDVSSVQLFCSVLRIVNTYAKHKYYISVRSFVSLKRPRISNLTSVSKS